MEGMVFNEVKESRRIYRWKGDEVTVENVVRIHIRPSGTNRIETENGHKHIICFMPDGILHIEFEGPWVF